MVRGGGDAKARQSELSDDEDEGSSSDFALRNNWFELTV